MNNYENMPEIIPTDVDITIDKETFKKLDSILLNIASKHNVEIIQKIWHGYHKCAYILSPLKIDEKFRLQLDFFIDFSAKGYPNLLSNRILLDKRKKYKNFFIPEAEIEYPFLVIRRIVKNDMRKAHMDKMKFLIEQDSINTKKNLEKIFGEGISNSIIKLIETGDNYIFQSQIGEYRNALKKWSKKNTQFEYMFKYGISQCGRIIQRLLHPVGFTVVLLGPDGSGKSTIAKRVLERVSGSFHGGRVQYWRPYLLPAMGRLKFWNPSEEVAINPRPHDHPEQNRFKSLLRFFYYLTDYLIGYPVKIYWKKVKKNIIVFDRYYYDYLVDLYRYQFNIPQWLPKMFLPLIPAPDMTIYLDADPEVLHKRKQELSLSELERQVKEFKQILPQIPNSISVSTDKPVGEIVGEISYLILKKKSLQTKKILTG
jgi:thymidylate kinase